MCNIAIVGGGASGLCCAILLKRQCKKISVTIYEAKERVGKKLAVTGNGRCNISNAFLDRHRYHGDAEFAMNIISKFDFSNQKSFFESIGVPFVEANGKAYPRSLQAASVVDALRFEAEELGVNIRLSDTVDSIERIGNKFIIKNKEYDAVLLATGGIAGSKNLNNYGYDILRKFGHKIEQPFPSLVQIETDTDIVRQLQGIKIQADIIIETHNRTKRESGELLFCEYGISGPPVLQISRLVSASHSTIKIDITPEYTKEELTEFISQRVIHNPTRKISELFAGFINKKLSHVIFKKVGININDTCNTINHSKINELANELKSFTLKAKRTKGFENAQVTAGGAQTAQFFDTLMSKKVKGLFIAGELLNVDGDCGGFNLAFAWASAYVASQGIIDYIENR